MRPTSIDDTIRALDEHGYIAEHELATSVFLALRLQRALLLEGEAGVGKTELSRALASVVGAPLIRLQCYEGLDAAQALYDWDYARQMLEIRLLEAGGEHDTQRVRREIFGPAFLIRRPLLQAIDPADGRAPVLLIDEIDRADEEFEAFLLELLGDWQVTIPEVGTIRAKEPPIVVITSNRTREIHDALKRRCLYLWIPIPTSTRSCASSSARCRTRPTACRVRSSRSCRRSAASICTSRRASRKRSTGPPRCSRSTCRSSPATGCGTRSARS
jgi:MoxR-like ATPase